MPEISAPELAMMQTEAQIVLRARATIRRYTEATDSYGTVLRTWATIATLVPCEVAPSTYLPTEQIEYGRVTAAARWMLAVPALQDVVEKDEIDVHGMTYEVVAMYAPTSTQILKRMLCEIRDR